MSRRCYEIHLTLAWQRIRRFARAWSAVVIQVGVPTQERGNEWLKKQARIATILDKFDALTSAISEGLPREIGLRQKQYHLVPTLPRGNAYGA